MRINTNISAMNTYSRLTAANTSKAGSLAKLSSGLRINKAGDDAAGLSISEKMRGQVSGLKQSVRNAQDGISLIQTAEGALSETHSILQRMRELSVQSANDTNTVDDRAEIQKEVDELAQEMTRIGETTQFNTQNLLNGDYTGKKFHIGANSGQDTTIDILDMRSEALEVQGKIYEGKGAATTGELSEVNFQVRDTTVQTIVFDKVVAAAADTAIDKTTAAYTTDGKVTITLAQDNNAKVTATAEDVKNALRNISGTESLEDDILISYTGLTDTIVGDISAGDTISLVENTSKSDDSGLNVSTQSAADDAIKTLDDAISNVSAERSKLGATQNRLEHTINNLNATAENLSEAESRIRDVDMAEEMMEFTKSNILSQAATAMLAQANQMPQGVLQLLQ